MRALGAWWFAYACAALACGDNAPPIGKPLARADVLFLAAHPDDDFIFMQPGLSAWLQSGAASTTIYMTTAGPEGVDLTLFEAAKVAYGAAVGSSAWECGRIELGTLTADHCRLRDRPVSLVDFGLPDGGIPGSRQDSMLHLVDGTVSELAGFYGGSVTADSVVDLVARVLDQTRPSAVETLDLAASHGRDHSSHLFVASLGLWAAARVGYSGATIWNRGYNVDVEPPTLHGDELANARTLLGYYEACAYGCGPCGEPCPAVLEAHEIWLSRQYARQRVPEASGKLALGDACLDASLALGDCAAAPPITLAPTGSLRIGDRCLASTAGDELVLEPCTSAPAQYWALDSRGALWNGRPPAPAADMTYDHVRCLSDAGVPTCGANLQPHWRFVP